MPAGPAESFALPVSEPCARFLLSVAAVPPFFFFFFIATGAAFMGAERASPGVARVAAGGLASDALGGSPPAPPCATASPHMPASSAAVIKTFFIPISLDCRCDATARRKNNQRRFCLFPKFFLIPAGSQPHGTDLHIVIGHRFGASAGAR